MALWSEAILGNSCPGHHHFTIGTTTKVSEHAWCPANPLHCVSEFLVSMGKIQATHMPSLNPCELLPEALARIQLRSLGREALNVEAWRRAMSQELVDDVTAMHRCPTPDEQGIYTVQKSTFRVVSKACVAGMGSAPDF
jgi:hypothetical protein